jgi:acyl dehydratase
MVAAIRYEDVSVGSRLPERETVVSRLSLLLYGGQAMKLDFAGIHWSERIARSEGLPDVIMHGPFILQKSLETLYDWTGDPGAVVDQRIRFLQPVPVPDDETGAVLRFAGDVVDKLSEKLVSVAVETHCQGAGLVARLNGTVRLA